MPFALYLFACCRCQIRQTSVDSYRSMHAGNRALHGDSHISLNLTITISNELTGSRHHSRIHFDIANNNLLW